MLDRFNAALNEAGEEPALRAALHEIVAWAFLLMREDMRTATHHARLAVQLGEQVDDPAQLSDALAVQAQAEFFLGGGLLAGHGARARDPLGRPQRAGDAKSRLHWSLCCNARTGSTRPAFTSRTPIGTLSPRTMRAPCRGSRCA